MILTHFDPLAEHQVQYSYVADRGFIQSKDLVSESVPFTNHFEHSRSGLLEKFNAASGIGMGDEQMSRPLL
jgi:hypothetical protein